MTATRRVLLAARLDLRDLVRRPLILVLLVVTPSFFISRAIASTEARPRIIRLANGSTVATTMRDIHGADMALITVAFLAGLIGVFIMNAARQADGRLARAGFGATETVLARLVTMVLCTLLVTLVSILTTAKDFSPQHWTWFVLGTVTIGLTFACLGALASAMLGRLGATYLLLFAAMLDLGVVQNPMFGTGSPPGWGVILPGYPGAGVALSAALSRDGPVPAGLLLAMVTWLFGLLFLTVWLMTAELRARR